MTLLNVGSPKGRESYGDRVPLVVAGVTSCQSGDRESRTTGRRGTGDGCQGTMRYAKCRTPKRYLRSSASAAGRACRDMSYTDRCSIMNGTWWPTGTVTPIQTG